MPFLRIFGVTAVPVTIPGGGTLTLVPDTVMFTFEHGPRGGLHVTGFIAVDAQEVSRPVPRRPHVGDGWIEPSTAAVYNRQLADILDMYPGMWKTLVTAPTPRWSKAAAKPKVKMKTNKQAKVKR